MAKCSVCGEPGHTTIRHDAACIVCGQKKQFASVEEAKEARDSYKCGDIKAHEAVRGLWDLPREEALRVRDLGVQRR